MQRRQIKFLGVKQGWTVLLKIPQELHNRLESFCNERKQSFDDVLGQAFAAGIISEEAIESYLANESHRPQA